MTDSTKDKIQFRRRSSERVSQRILYGMVGCTLVVFAVFFLIGYDTPYWKNESMNAPLLTDLVMGEVYVMVGLTTIMAIAAAIHSAKMRRESAAVINRIPARRISLSVSLLTIVVIVCGFLLSSTDPMTINGEKYTSWWGLKISGTLITTATVMLLAAIGASLFGATRYHRKGHQKG